MQKDIVTVSLVLVALMVSLTCGASFDVTDYGAVADGVHDDTQAILTCLKAAGRAGSGTVLLPPSKKPYLITDSIRIESSNIHLVGTGATVYLKDGAGTGRTDPKDFLHVVYIVGDPDSSIKNVTIEGLTIDANYWGQGAVAGGWQQSAAVAGHPRGLRVEHARKVLVDKVTIRRAFVGLTFGLGCFDCEARDTTVTLWHHDGFGASPDVNGGSRNIRFIRCRAVDAPSQDQEGGLPGFRIKAWEIEDGVHNVKLKDCLVENTGGCGYFVRLHGADNQLVRNVEFVGCKVRNVQDQGWFIRGWRANCHTRDVRLIDCSSDAPVAILVGAEDVRIKGGQYEGKMSIGFYADYLSNLPSGHMYKRLPARSVSIEDASVRQVVINAQQGNDGKELYWPRVTLKRVKLADGVSVLAPKGPANMEHTVSIGGRKLVVMKNCDFGTEPLYWQDIGVRMYDPVPKIEKPTGTASYCETAPEIDGDAKDQCWSRAGPADIMHNSSRPEKRIGQTLVRFCYNDEGLYVLFTCLETNMAKLRASGKNRDDDIWFDDCVELFLNRSNDPRGYFRQWMSGPSGGLYDADSVQGPKWNTSARVAAKLLADRYVVEMFIPWDDLGGALKDGESFRANLARNKTTDHTRWIWSWQYTAENVAFGDPKVMGVLLFR